MQQGGKYTLEWPFFPPDYMLGRKVYAEICGYISNRQVKNHYGFFTVPHWPCVRFKFDAGSSSVTQWMPSKQGSTLT